jgi:GntR family transcriptional regulator
VQNQTGSARDALGELRLDVRRPEPLHKQLADGLRSLILAGRLPEGAQVPGELHLAAQFQLGRQTVRHALGTLVTEGLLIRERGSGTVVASRPITRRHLERFYAFAWEQQARGARHFSRVLDRGLVTADQVVAQHLGLSTGSTLEVITLLRTADAQPWSLETSMFPPEIGRVLDRLDLETESIYDMIERLAGIRITGAREWLRAVNLSSADAYLLQIEPNTAAFSVERVTSGEDNSGANKPVEFRRSLLRADRYVYIVDLPSPRTS